MDSEVLVEVSGLSKIFCRDLRRSLYYGLHDSVADLTFHGEKSGKNRTLRKGEFWANYDISFQLKRGECLGLIGANGAGKTTLLKMLNGLIKPDAGYIEMRGRVGALIALGAGFSPILTGRENVYINGAVLGLRRSEIDQYFDEIVSFAELEDFIDTPVQNYSSGMQVRLGFAIASTLKPDILIIDEVLAVGDANFRTKCLLRISSLLERCAVIFVSHHESQIQRLCKQVLWLQSGKIKGFGPTERLLTEYILSQSTNQTSASTWIKQPIRSLNAKLIDDSIRYGDDLKLRIRLDLSSTSYLGRIIIGVCDNSNEGIAQTTLQIGKHLNAGVSELLISIHNLQLKSGTYSLNLNIYSDDSGKAHIARQLQSVAFKLESEFQSYSCYQPASNLVRIS